MRRVWTSFCGFLQVRHLLGSGTQRKIVLVHLMDRLFEQKWDEDLLRSELSDKRLCLIKAKYAINVIYSVGGYEDIEARMTDGLLRTSSNARNARNPMQIL